MSILSYGVRGWHWHPEAEAVAHVVEVAGGCEVADGGSVVEAVGEEDSLRGLHDPAADGPERRIDRPEAGVLREHERPALEGEAPGGVEGNDY